MCNTELPEETIKILDNFNVRGKAEENMERYKYAEQETGLPWQVLAALHFREASMGSNKSISNGQPLTKGGGCYKNVDNITICSDANADAKQSAEIFIENAKRVYGVDVVSDPSLENLG